MRLPATENRDKRKVQTKNRQPDKETHKKTDRQTDIWIDKKPIKIPTDQQQQTNRQIHPLMANRQRTTLHISQFYALKKKDELKLEFFGGVPNDP